MILLKKFISFTIAVLSLGLFLCGCASKNSSDDGSKTEATSQPFTERQVDTAEGTFIFDNAGLLSADDLKACNDYAGWLYSYKLINTAVVTTNDLGGKSPSGREAVCLLLSITIPMRTASGGRVPVCRI